MKNILSKLGYVSKPVLIGTALGVATVAVGIGIVTQFSGGSKSPKGFSGAALERYAGDSSSSSFGGSSALSREQIEARMAAAEMARGTNSVHSLKDAAAKEQFAFGQKGGVNGATGAGSNAAGSSGAYGSDDDAASLKGSALDPMSAMGGGISAIDAGAVPSGSIEEAAAAAKAAQAKELATAEQNMGNAMASAKLRTSKGLGASGSASGSTGSGSSGGFGASMTLPGSGSASSDRAATTSIPQANLPADSKAKDPGAFKGGRLGAMGGFGVQAGGDKAGGQGQQRFSGSLSDLNMASRYSQMGKDTVYGDGGKGAALAAAAFDGSEKTEGVEISGTNVQQGALAALDTIGSSNPNWNKNRQNVNKKLDAIDVKVQTVKDIKDKIKSKLIQLSIITAVACIAIFAATKTGPWGWLAGAILAAAAIATIWAYGIPKLLKQLKELEGGTSNMHWLSYAALGLMTAAVAASFIVANFAGLTSQISSFFGGIGAKISGALGGSKVASMVGGAALTTLGGAVQQGAQSTAETSDISVEPGPNGKPKPNPYPKGSEDWANYEQAVKQIGGY